jgi:hypothetical protein
MGRFRKDPFSPGHRGNFYCPEGRGEKLFLIIVSVLGHSNFEGDMGLTSNSLHGGGIDVLWNDPMSDDFTCQ